MKHFWTQHVSVLQWDHRLIRCVKKYSYCARNLQRPAAVGATYEREASRIIPDDRSHAFLRMCCGRRHNSANVLGWRRASESARGTVGHHLVDVVLPTRNGVTIRKCCVGRPTEHQAILLHHLGLFHPNSLQIAQVQGRPGHTGIENTGVYSSNCRGSKHCKSSFRRGFQA